MHAVIIITSSTTSYDKHKKTNIKALIRDFLISNQALFNWANK